MIFIKFILTGKMKRELDTEIRFLCASARADGAELICFAISEDSGGKGHVASVKSVLSAMKKENLIHFYVTADRLDGRTVEADFLSNKYGEYLTPSNEGYFEIYVKLQ